VRLSLSECPFHCFLIIVLCVMIQSSIASAHNVVSGVYADGMMIEGEIGFSNGDMAQAGSPVKVYGSEGGLIAELTLAEGGVFSYQAKTATKHIFKSNLSAGHIAEMVIEANELIPVKPLSTSDKPPLIKRSMDSRKPQTSDNKVGNTPLGSDGSSLGSNITVEQLESIVRSAVAQQIRPLQKELRAYKEKVMFRDITGGLGFIFGLFGVAAWMASKRKQGDKNAAIS